MKLTAITCPKCGANNQIDEGRKTFFCSYCGAQIAVDDGSTTINFNETYRDEARLKDIDAKTMIRLKELEQEKEERDRKNKYQSLFMKIYGAGFVLLLLVYFFRKLTGGDTSILPIYIMLAAMWGILLFVMPVVNKNNNDQK